jgi:ribosomal protein S18 acetylase RimI-like enzyme
MLARNRSDRDAVETYLRACDAAFRPPLSERVDLTAYAEKIAARAERFEAWDGARLAGLVAAYCNDPERRAAFVTSVSVAPQLHGRGVASRLLGACIDHARASGFARVELEVDARNEPALALYRRHGFVPAGPQGQARSLHLAL